MNHSFYKQSGMTLVELAISVLIISLIGGTMLLNFSEQKDQAQWVGSEAKLAVVKTAILKFTEKNSFMPCPDSTGNGFENRITDNGNLAAVSAATGTAAVVATNEAPAIPAIPATPAQAAINNIPVSRCAVSVGEVPYETLGLGPNDARDTLGNEFVYAVDQGVVNPSLMIDCPTQSACFFNSDELPSQLAAATLSYKALPAYDLTTQPIKGSPGANNLNICSDLNCNAIEADDLIAVLIAENNDGLAIENQDGDVLFASDEYSVSDDQLIGISANEIKKLSEEEAVETVTNFTPSNNQAQTGNDTGAMGDNNVGTQGTNLSTDDAIVDSDSQSFSFGADAAGMEVVVTFDSHTLGAWENRSGHTPDRGEVFANGSSIETFDNDWTLDAWDGLEQATFTSAINGRYGDVFNADGSWDGRYFNVGQEITTWQPYWNESHEYVVFLDANGNITLDFEVQTTATVETIDFTDIELVLFNTPPDIPDFPSVAPISGINQTQGLN